jgi:hypothetical protein
MTTFAKLCSGLALSAAVMFALPSAGRAAVSFQFVAGQSTYGAAPGQTATVQIFLRETGGPSQLVAQDGLFSTGVRIVRTGITGTGLSPTGADADAGFDLDDEIVIIDDEPVFIPGLRQSGVTATDAFFAGARQATSGGPTGVENGNGGRDVLLGTFSFAVPTGATGSSTFRIEDVSAGFDDTTTYGPADAETTTVLDPLIGTSPGLPNGTFIVLAPEPASLAALAGAGIVALRRRRRA